MPRRPTSAPFDEAFARLAETPTGIANDLDPVGGVFVGRDRLLYDLEVAGRLQKVVILHGQY